jgi:hypothetical protein
MRSFLIWPSFAALALGSFLLAGCAQEDRRLAEDQQSCRAMGHVSGTPQFQQCMEELNQRRCATVSVGKPGTTRHQAVLECTRLPSS